MARASLVLSVLVASPGDVSNEREAVVDAINQWNSEHSRKTKLHLEAVRWETHAHPATGGRPQEFVNTQIADDCDLAIAVFGRRVGTPTGEAESGTIEEIERFRSKRKPVALYFSNAPLPRDFDRPQYEKLNAYQEQRKKDSLVWEYSDAKALQELVRHHLPKLVEDAHKSLRESGQLEQVEAQLRDSEQAVSRDLRQMAASEPWTRLTPLEIDVGVHSQYPDPTLLLQSNKDVTLKRVDYLDNHGARAFHFEYHNLAGREFKLPIHLNAVTEIWNRGGRNGTFVLHLTDGNQRITHKLPISIDHRSKTTPEGGTVFYMHLVG